jgi:hypothetical protein
VSNPYAFEVPIKLRDWQRPLVRYFRTRREKQVPAHASVVAHRRAGKDRVALFIELEEMLHRGQPGEAWHCLPEYAQARKVVWQALDGDGRKLIDVAFPREIVRRRNEQEMTIELVTGALWRLVGADNFNALVGSSPKHVTFSEYALTQPNAREFVRPILAANGGTELTITTPRGYNHAFHRHEHAKKTRDWYYATHPVSQTRLLPKAVLDEERKTMAEELYAQEYECSFSAANVGSILGTRVEDAERDGRIGDYAYDSTLPVVLSSDIGHRDAAAFWFWQVRPDGFALIDYREESGLEADEWIEKLRGLPYDYGETWLPHDARAKTFATKRSALERFISAGFKARIVPLVSVSHRINAARIAMPQCHFNASMLERGLHVLRSWSFKWDDQRRVFSLDPQHDEYSHGGDAFSYGCLVMKAHKAAAPVKPSPAVAINTFSLDQLHSDRERYMDDEHIG